MQTFQRKKAPKRVKPNAGKSITIAGQAPSVRNLFEQMASGFPLPSARQELDFNLDINEIVEDQFDLPDLNQYQNLDQQEQLQIRENLRGLKQAFIQKIEAKQQELDVPNVEPTPPPVEPTPPPA